MAGTSELKCLLEAETFNEKMELYLRPLAKAEIVVKLPKITVPGQSISNWDLMERLKKIVNPIQFDAIKVRESSLESVIFETELLSKAMLRQAMKMLTGQTMKVAGFAELLQISIHEAKSDFPSRHDWDLFYMKNNLNETKPGERPDTIYLAKIPVKWFNDGKLDGPCEILLERAMAVFGRIRRVDVPICDPMRALMPQKFSGFQQKGFTFGQEVLFEAYVQYEEYSGFEAAMNALRNMKWVKKIDGKIFQANVKVDFDRSGHLSEAVIDRREAERSRLVDEKRRELEAELNAKEEEERKQRLADLEKLRRQEEREQKRRQKRDEERRREEEHRRKEEERKTREQAEKEEDRRYRQKTILQSQRLLECVFSRIEAKENRRKLEFEEDMIQQKSQLDELDGEDKEQALRNVLLLQRERDLREKLFEKMAGRATQPKSVEEPESNHEAENGRRKHKKSSRKHKNRHSRSSSSSSSSRSRSRSSRRHQKKKKKHRHRSRSR